MGAILHRPYQAETEFACDIANTPQSWVFVIVMEQAAADADVYGTTDSINGVQPACHNFNFGRHFPTCPSTALQCDQAVSCSGGQVCDPQMLHQRARVYHCWGNFMRRLLHVRLRDRLLPGPGATTQMMIPA
jgi:hypothetical protein